ncbi:unnamed protein product, partial [Mesorhabditis spiculigera]
MADVQPPFETEKEADTDTPEKREDEQGASGLTDEANTQYQPRYILDHWVTWQPDGRMMKYVNEVWEEVIEEDDRTLLSQLWNEQQRAETEKVVDGVKLKWDPTTQQWLPQELDDDFLANYQANYGVAYDYSKIEVKKPVVPVEKKEEKKKETKEERAKRKRENRQKVPQQGWIENEANTAVYVTNLPLDIDEEEFQAFMTKCGVIQVEPRNNKPKIKLYREADGSVKGDGRCTYVKPESVELALSILDGSEFNGSKITVEPAHFTLKGEYDPAKKKRRLTAQQKKRFLEQQNKIFAWTPDKPRNYRPKAHCTVVLKGVFTLEEMEQNAALMLDLKEVYQKLSAKYGTVKKVVVYDTNPDGVVTVSYTNTEEADLAIKMLDKHLINGKLLDAYNWDGKAKFKVEETEEQRQARLERYGRELEGNDDEDKSTESGGDTDSSDDTDSSSSDGEEQDKRADDNAEK